MKDLFVVTHAQSVHHIEKKVAGWFDTGLTEQGQQDALFVAAALLSAIGDKEVEIYPPTSNEPRKLPISSQTTSKDPSRRRNRYGRSATAWRKADRRNGLMPAMSLHRMMTGWTIMETLRERRLGVMSQTAFIRSWTRSHSVAVEIRSSSLTALP